MFKHSYKELFLIIIIAFFAIDETLVYAGEFHGNPLIEQLDTIKYSQHVKLIREFTYVDNSGETWTSGTNRPIPIHLLSDEIRQLRPLPSEFDYLKTTLIYQSQSVQATEPWRRVRNIVFEALIDEGLQEHIAKMIYAAVRAEGWRWEPIGSSCYSSCHSNTSVLRWRAIPDYGQLHVTLDWILKDFPTTNQIDNRIDALILKTGPHIFGQ